MRKIVKILLQDNPHLCWSKFMIAIKAALYLNNAEDLRPFLHE